MKDIMSDREFIEYTRRHHASWVTFVRGKGHGDVQPILVTGFDTTRDFSMVAYSNEGAPLGLGSTITIPPHEPTAARVTWRAGRPPHTNYCQERLLGAEDAPGESGHCVFIRYFSVQAKMWEPLFHEAAHGNFGGGGGKDTLPLGVLVHC